MATKLNTVEVSHLGGVSKDTTLIAGVSGDSIRITAINLVAQGPQDNNLKNRWLLTEGQYFDTGNIAMTGNPDDGGTFTLTDSDGTVTIFEFDDDESVSGTNTLVTIGTDVAATLTNLYNAILALTNLNLEVTLTSTTIDFVENIPIGVADVAENATSTTVTSFTDGGGAVLFQGYAFNHQPVVCDVAFGGTISAPQSIQCGNDIALNLSVLGSGGLTLMGNVYYVQE